MGKFKKGESGNPAGRPNGKSNKLTKEFRESLHDALRGDIERISEYLHELDAKDKLDVLSKLLPYVMPKYQSIEIEGSLTQREPIDLEGMSIAELEARAEAGKVLLDLEKQHPELNYLSTEELENRAKES